MKTYYIKPLLLISIVIITGYFAIFCDLHLENTDVEPVVNITHHNWTLNSTECFYHNETLGTYSAGHGDGICTHSSFYCNSCNCSARTERWCDNETLELERLKEKYGDD
jgi:hypothetical protein